MLFLVGVIYNKRMLLLPSPLGAGTTNKDCRGPSSNFGNHTVKKLHNKNFIKLSTIYTANTKEVFVQHILRILSIKNKITVTAHTGEHDYYSSTSTGDT